MRSKDAQKILDALVARIRLPPEDEALRQPKSIADARAILLRDTVYLFPQAAAYAHGLNNTDGRMLEATMELVMGESQLVASQVLSIQEAWISNDLRIARANIATTRGTAMTDRARILQQLVLAVEDGNTIAAALAQVAPAHITRGAELARVLRTEAPTDARTWALTAEYHRLRGEWTEFDAAMREAEQRSTEPSRALRYLRAMEQLERHRKPVVSAKLLREALVEFPNFVRAQAALVVTAQRPRQALRELAHLKRMNAEHYLVMLLEPALAAEQELLHQNGVDDAQQ